MALNNLWEFVQYVGMYWIEISNPHLPRVLLVRRDHIYQESSEHRRSEWIVQIEDTGSGWNCERCGVGIDDVDFAGTMRISIH